MTSKIRGNGGVAPYDVLQARWERVHAREGEVYVRTKKMRQARGSETIATLKVWYAATGDIAFREAIEAAQKRGFDRQNSSTLKRARDMAHGYNEEVSLAMMVRLLRRGRTLRSAAARTAVAYSVPGNSFDAVVKKLERAYRRFRQSAAVRVVVGYPVEPPTGIAAAIIAAGKKARGEIR